MLVVTTKPLLAPANGKVNNKTQARRPAFITNIELSGKRVEKL
jgi:hypothetical protein